MLLSQANLRAGVDNVIRAHDITNLDVAFCCMPLSHINGIVTTLLTPLVSGGAVVFFQGTFTPRDFLAAFAHHGATWLSASPMHYQLLLYSGGRSSGLGNCRFGRCGAASRSPAESERS